MKTKSIILAGLLVLCCACVDDIDRTIFIPDDIDPNLPAYTEWGYNSFGAKYERLYFLADQSIVPCKITYRERRLHFSLLGVLKGDGYSGSENMTLTISFPSEPENEYRDLLALHERVTDLSDPSSCTVEIAKPDGAVMTVVPIEGNLTFRRVQLLRIDEKENRVILSGTFDIRFLTNDKPERITDGRFDVGIKPADFYSFD
jgi:hypothetical protein